MAKVSKQEVEHLARLARIAVSAAEAKQMTKELEAILGYVAKLKAVDTEGVEQTSQVTGLKNVSRPDKVIRSKISRQQLLANAPQTKGDFIKVKKVL